MAYKKMISGAYIDADKDVKTVMRFIIDQFGGIHYQHPHHDNLLYLDKKIWWVAASADKDAVDVCNGNDCNKCELIREIKRLDSGILFFRQLEDNRICIYLIDNMEKLERHCESSLIFNWDTVESIKLFSETGIVMGDELIGFRQFRRLRNDTVQSHYTI